MTENKLKVTCPKCESENIAACHGSTCITEIEEIDYICTDCAYEFGKEKI